jgi:hypothetical protein
MANDGFDIVVRPAAGDVTDLLGKAEDLVLSAIASNDPTEVFQEIAFLRRDVQLKGVVVAKLLSDLWDKWPELKGVDISFNGFVEAASVGTGLAARTIKPYIRMWRAVFVNKKVPSALRPIIMGFPVSTLLYLQPAAEDGTLDTKWKEIAECETPAEVKSKVREWRGSNTSSESAVHIYLGRDGRLKTRRGTKGNYKAVGYLEMNSDDELVKIAIHRIINAAGLVELD